MLMSASIRFRSIAVIPAIAGVSLFGACRSSDDLERTAWADHALVVGAGSGLGSGTDAGSGSGSGSGDGSGSDVQDPPPLGDSFTFDGYAGPCPVHTTYSYGDISAGGTVTITSPDAAYAVTMPFYGDGDASTFGFSFGAASGQYTSGQESWSGDDTANDQSYAWLGQCGEDYTQATSSGSGAAFELMADCTNYGARYAASLQNRDRAAGRGNTDMAISLGSAALAMSPGRFLRWGLFGVRGTRIALGATAGASQFMASGNQNSAASFASAANAHCEGWRDCCNQAGGPHTGCPANCTNNHGAGRGS
jgi:hypothetical protein